MSNGNLIVFTGIDGSGKTTQAQCLVKNLQDSGIAVSYAWSRWEPYILKPFIILWKGKQGKVTAQSVRSTRDIKNRKRKFLKNPFLRSLWLCIFIIEYSFQIFIRIKFKLIQGKFIVSDRIFYDSLIDQAINLGKKEDWLINILSSLWIRLFFPTPDMVFYIDCPENVALARQSEGLDTEYLSERRELYLRLCDEYRWLKLDGTLPAEILARQVRDNVRHILEI